MQSLGSETPRKLKCAVIREELIAITGDMLEAVILNQFLYWSEKVRDFDKFLAEEKERQHASDSEQCQILFTHGWIYKTAGDMKDEVMCHESPKTVGRKIRKLVEKGFLSQRRNPSPAMKFDRRYYYRVNFVEIVRALDKTGYVLSGYTKLSFNDSYGDPVSAIEPGLPVDGKRQIVHSNGHDVHSNRHSVATITETKAKITPENTSSPSFSPFEGKVTPVTVEDDTGELASFFAGMGLEQLRHQEAVQWLTAIIADLWHTRRIGKEQVLASTIRKALGALTPQLLDAMIDRVYRQRQKGNIPLPDLYVQRAILNAARSAGFDEMAQQGGGGEAHAPTYDIESYIDLSMQRLLGGDGP